ncbi:MAG: fibronectin type III domain-containing protein [Treponema sp.]|nr:fibronectin type III domain-containing protein [Treponema sp.]
MANKKLCLGGILVLALVFGITIIGCEEEPEKDTNPLPPTGLTGTAESNSVELTWNSVNNADEYLVQYKKNSDTTFITKTGINTASYTVTDLVPATKYDFKVAVINTDGYTSQYSNTISVETKAPATGSVSISGLTTKEQFVSGSYGGYSYTIGIFLKLSEGTYWNTATPSITTAKEWVSVTGITLNSWNFQVDYEPALGKDTLNLYYTRSGLTSSMTMPPGGITVSINQVKLAEMKGYTNATDSITLGSPAYRLSSAWTSP